MTELERIKQRLLAPFPITELELRCGAGRGVDKHIPLIYVDTRAVSHRLNTVLGLENYSVEISDMNAYHENWMGKKDDGSKQGLCTAVVVKLIVNHPELKTIQTNIGEKSLDAGDSGNKFTTAYAQAYKRAASHLGIGQYLYYMKVTKAFDSKYGKFVNESAVFDAITNDMWDTALDNVGFNFLCEETGEKLSWNIAARSMEKFGRILSPEYVKKQKNG
jgi:hypothetical protein